MLPCCDVGNVVLSRPSLVLDVEWARVPKAVADLLDIYQSGAAVASLAEAQSAVLAQDIPALIESLERCVLPF
jgi:hypothetical protein